MPEMKLYLALMLLLSHVCYVTMEDADDDAGDDATEEAPRELDEKGGRVS